MSVETAGRIDITPRLKPQRIPEGEPLEEIFAAQAKQLLSNVPEREFVGNEWTPEVLADLLSGLFAKLATYHNNELYANFVNYEDPRELYLQLDRFIPSDSPFSDGGIHGCSIPDTQIWDICEEKGLLNQAGVPHVHGLEFKSETLNKVDGDAGPTWEYYGAPLKIFPL